MTARGYTIEEGEATIEGSSSPKATMREYGVSLVEGLTHLARRKGMIAKVTAIAMLVGVTLALVLPVQYTATTKLMPPQQTQSAATLLMSQLGNGAGSLAAIAGGGLSLRNPNDIYIGLLTSRPIADAIIQKFNLAEEYHARDMTEARIKLAGCTEVTTSTSGFIAVSVTDKDKKRVAELANAYSGELRNLTQNLAVTEASQRRLFYETQLKQSKDALLSAGLSFEQIQQQRGLIHLDAQARAMIAGDAAVRAQIAAKQVEVEALRSYSTEQNPDVQLAERELTSLQSEEARLERRNHEPGFTGLGLESVPRAGMEYLRAEHELQFQQALYDILMKQYDAAKLDEGKEAAIIQVVEPAIEPDRKSSPRRTQLVVYFTLIGLLSGCFLAILLQRIERATSDPISRKRLEELNLALRWRKSRSS